MQAAILYAPNDLRIEERPMPEISPEEMRIEVGRVRHLRQRCPDLPLRRRQYHRAGDNGARNRGRHRGSGRRGRWFPGRAKGNGGSGGPLRRVPLLPPGHPDHVRQPTFPSDTSSTEASPNTW